MKYVFSVSKTYKHRGQHRHKKSTKKHWCIYYCDELGRFGSEMVSFSQAMYYKTKKYRRLKYYCEACGKLFVLLAKSRKQLECHNCFVD